MAKTRRARAGREEGLEETKAKTHLQPLLIQHTTPIELPQPQFELNIILEDLLLRSESNSETHNLPRFVESEITNFELGKLFPDFGESELLVREKLEECSVDLIGSVQVLQRLVSLQIRD